MSRETFTVPENVPITVPENVPRIGLRSVFSQAVISNVLNPKIAIFFLAYLPQFASRSASGTKLLLLGLSFALLTWIVFSGLGCFSGSLGNKISNQPIHAKALNRVIGGVLMALGLRLALTQKP